jgi:hypothetical protein
VSATGGQPKCNRCGRYPRAPGSGWCRLCLSAEDERRDYLAVAYLPDAQRRRAYLRAVCRDLEDALWGHYADGVERWVLARDLDLPRDVVVALINRASARDIAWRRGRGPRPRRKTRLLASRKPRPTGSANRASIELDVGVHWARNGHAPRARTCPICLVVFEPARTDQECCTPRCRRVKHRLKSDDPEVRAKAWATVEWLHDPPSCDGCGEPLTGMRAGSRVHGDTCRKKAKRNQTVDGVATSSKEPAS